MLIGWQGIAVETPGDWSPVTLRGRRDHGLIELAAPGALQMLIRWERAGGADPADVVRRYAARLERSARRPRSGAFRTGPRGLGPLRPPREHAVTFAWEADRSAVGCAWRCAECGLLLLAEVSGPRGADLSSAARLLRAVRDHGKPGWTAWSVYGLAVEVPEGMALTAQQLVAGYQRLELADRTARLRAERWALAEQALRGTDLLTWWVRQQPGTFRELAARAAPATVGPHPAWCARVRLGAAAVAVELARAASSLRSPRMELEARFWHCPNENRILSLVLEHASGGSALAEIVARLPCRSCTAAAAGAPEAGW